MKIIREEQVLEQEYRIKVIEEINSEENIKRKNESYLRYQIYRDKIKKHIKENLLQELDPDTVDEMSNRISSVNIFKKMVSKKARVYKDTPKRETVDDNQDWIDSMVDVLNLNTTMKKVNRYVEAFRNCLVYVKPYKDYSFDSKWSYMLDVLAPHKFDVIIDEDNHKLLRGVVLSDFKYNGDVEKQKNPTRTGDGTHKDTTGDHATEYIFWTKSYHFTCDENGEIINGAENLNEPLKNPIERLPFIPFSKDQDDSFWSIGGDDMVDGTILINTLLTDLYYIMRLQGFGLFYLFGAKVPEQYKVGPNKAITMKVEEGDPTPQIGFASSTPPIESHMAVVEQYIAFLLSTNDLGTNSVSGTLQASTAASGIHEMIINSEPTNAIEDEQEQYKDREPEILQVANNWQKVFIDGETGLSLVYNDIGYTDDVMYRLTFEKPVQYKSEVEKLDVIGKKIEQGIWNKVDALMADNPKLTREEALKVLLERAKENVKLMQNGIETFINGNDADDEDGDDDGNSNSQENQD